jgi:hypothetical protein
MRLGPGIGARGAAVAARASRVRSARGGNGTKAEVVRLAPDVRQRARALTCERAIDTHAETPVA